MGVWERKEREKELRKQAIITAAEKLFISKGMMNTSIEHIAAEIEMSRGAIYLHFKNKEDIFISIINKALSTLLDMLKSAAEEVESPEEKMLAIGRAYMRFYKEHRSSFVIANFMLDKDEDALKKGCEEFKDKVSEMVVIDNEIWEFVIGVYDEGVRQGVFRSDLNSAETALMLWSASNGVIRFIDHIIMAHNSRPPTFESVEQGHTLEKLFDGISLDKLMSNLWDMTLNYIKVK